MQPQQISKEAVWWLWIRIGARRILLNPLRAISVVVSVALATTLMSAVMKVCVSSVQSFEQSIDAATPPSEVVVSPVGGRFVAHDLERCFASLSSVADVVAVRRESGVLATPTGKKVVAVAGVTRFASSNHAGVNAPGSVEISAALRGQLQARPDTRVELQVGSARIAGLVGDSEKQLSPGGGVDVLVPLGELDRPHYVDAVLIRKQDDAKENFVRELATFVRACIGPERPLRVETQSALLERSEALLAAYRTNILIMAFVTLLVCGLLISQATHLSMRLALRELAILRTLGVPGRACFSIIVVESAIMCLVGALVGCSIGYPITVWITGFLLHTAQDIYQVSIRPFGIALEAALALLVVLCITLFGACSAACAARTVVKLPPYRGTRREQVHNSPLHATTWIYVCAFTTIACLGSIAGAEYRPSAWSAYGSVSAVLVWVVSATPLALVGVNRWFQAMYGGMAWHLAQQSVRMAGRHFVLAGVAAALAIALMSGLVLMVSSFHGTLKAWSKTRLAGDLFVSSSTTADGNEGRIDQRYLSIMQQDSRLLRALPYYETATEISGASVVIGGVDRAAQCARQVYTFTEGGCEYRETGNDSGVIISESAARKLGIKLADTVTIDGAEFIVEGIVQEFGTERPLVVLTEERFVKLYPGHNPKTVTIDLLDSTKTAEVRQWLEGIAPQLLTIRDNQELRSLVDTLFRRTFRVTESVRWIVCCLAVLGLVSTGAQYVWERRRDFKTAQVLGASHSTLVLSVGFEALTVAVSALVIGLVGGVALGWCLTAYINPQVFGWSLTFSLSRTPVVEACGFLMGVVAVSIAVATILLRRISRRVRLADE